MRRANRLGTKATEVAIAHIVRKDEHDVRRLNFVSVSLAAKEHADCKKRKKQSWDGCLSLRERCHRSCDANRARLCNEDSLLSRIERRTSLVDRS